MGENELSLLQFLASRGGLRFDDAGALKAIGLHKRVRPMVPGLGYRNLTRAGGMSIDQAKAMAIEAGYLGEGDDFVSALADALQGRAASNEGAKSVAPPQAVGPAAEKPRVDIKVNTSPAPDPDAIRAAMGHLHALAADNGFNLTETEIEDAAQLAAARKIEPLEALAEVLERNALAAQAEAQAASKEMMDGRPDEPGRAGEARTRAAQALDQRVGP